MGNNQKKTYNAYRSYLRKRFGGAVYKIPVNGGFSCPNRDGTISSSGCDFCDNKLFSPRAFDLQNPVNQLRDVINSPQNKRKMFIAYLQPFTNTYGTVEKLKQVYEPLIAYKDVVGLAIGTRPDCFDKDIYEYLYDVSKRTYLSVELGLQTVNDNTLKRNNRGHGFAEFKDACFELSNRGIETVAHVILGLPGDTYEDMMQTATVLSKLPVDGVKIHQLMVVEGTTHARMYANGEITTMKLEEYVKILGDFISLLNPKQYIHRLLADSRYEYGLIAPDWCINKMKSFNYINKYFLENGITQGCKFKAS